MKINYTNITLNQDSINDTLKTINSNLSSKNEYFVIDKFYLMAIKNHQFDESKIKNQNIFKEKIILFIKKLITEVDNKNTNEIAIHHGELKKSFHPSNYTIAIEFLYQIGFLKKKILNYNDGQIQYYKKPSSDNGTGIITTYIITPFKDNQKDFALVAIAKSAKKQVINFKVELTKKEIDTLKFTKIDTKAALKAEFDYYNSFSKEEQKISSLLKRINRILSFGEHIYSTSGKNSKRVFHNLTNVSSISRKHLTFKGQKFNNIDLKNSQILFMIAYFINNNLEFDTNFKDDVCSGVVYNNFYGKGFADNRKEVKQELFRSVFFGFDCSAIFNQEFKIMYPLTWQTIKSIHLKYKNNKDCNLAILMQNEEHRAFSGIDLQSDGWFNLFDSIYCTSDADIDTIHQHLKNHFLKIGIENFAVTINE